MSEENNLPKKSQKDMRLKLPSPDPILAASSSEDLHQASPPYRPQASSSHLPFHSPYTDYPPSPAYRSRVDMHEQEDSDGKNLPKVQFDDKDIRPPSPYYHNDQQPGSGPPSTVGTDEEDGSDYDWSGDDDLVEEQAQFEHKMGVKKKRTGWGFKRLVTLLFSSLIGSTLLAGIIVTPALLVHFYWYKPHPTPYRHYVKENVEAWLFWAAANLLISWYLAVIIDIVPTVFVWMVSLAWGHVSERVKNRVELYNSVKNTIKPVFYAASGWVSWDIIFEHIFKLYGDGDRSAGYTRRVYQVVEFLFFFALVVCAQKMLSHFIAFSFHRTAYKERLEELGVALKTIEKLRDYRPKYQYQASTPGNRRSGFLTPLFTPLVEKDRFDFARKHHDDGVDGDTEMDGDKTLVNSRNKGKKANRLSTGSWQVLSGRRQRTLDEESPASSNPHSSLPMSPISAPSPSASIPMLEHRYPPTPQGTGHSAEASETLAAAAKVLKTAVLHDARNIIGENTNMSEVLGLGGVGTPAEAKRLARQIYYKFRPPHAMRKYLLPSDFAPAFPAQPDSELTHEIAFRVFDKDNNGDISRSEIKHTLLTVYKERRFLARSMRDVSSALHTLDRILLFFALVILFFISLQVFGVEVGDSLASVYSLGIAASFIFKNAASNAFDAIMFLFVTHPFDTGDRVFVDNENLVVKKMGLFATQFTRVDGTATYYFNSQLFGKFITNVRRSGKMFESCTIQVAWKTPMSKIDELERCMNEWLSTEENRWFEPQTSIMIQNVMMGRTLNPGATPGPNDKKEAYMELTVGIAHNGTWQDWGLTVTRRTAFHAAVHFFCRQLGIVGYNAPMPVVFGDTESGTYVPSEDEREDVIEGEGEGETKVVVGGDMDAEPERLVPPSLVSPSPIPPTPTSEVLVPPHAATASASGGALTTGFLGFKPTLASQLRARKSKGGRKAIMRMMDA